MTPERLEILRKHHKFGCHAVATLAEVEELLKEIENLKTALTQAEGEIDLLRKQAAEDSFAKENAYLDARETERTGWR